MDNPLITTIASPHVRWLLSDHAPVLREALQREDSWAYEQALEIERLLPVATTAAPFETDGYFRPVRHVRAFYINGPHGVIGIKGSEILTEDQTDLLTAGRLFRSPSLSVTSVRSVSILSLLERFPLLEHKVPGALLMSEAMHETLAAAEVQMAFLRRYGRLARLPLPLATFAWHADDVERFKKRLLPHLNKQTASIVARLIHEGLGCNAYYYPSSPRRVGQLMIERPEINRHYSYADRASALRSEFDCERAITGWLTLTAQLLALGFFPNSPYNNYCTGQCIQQQNAVLDGGFADVDSVQPMHSIVSDREFYETYLAMVAELAVMLRALLLGSLPVPNLEYADPTLPTLFLCTSVWDELRRLLRIERDAGGLADERLEQLLESRGIAHDLERGLAALYPQPKLTQSPPLRHFLGLREAGL